MTGSSARKLKSSATNLLTGRAFVYCLYPYSFLELGNKFDLNHALNWGTLPEVIELHNDEERQQFFMSYAHTCLKEKISAEQVVRNLAPFRKFLEVAAQCDGKIVNYTNITRDVKKNDKIVKSYFQVLEDTLIGFFLDPYDRLVRKRQSEKTKFYFFDTGVVRVLSVPLVSDNHQYGNAFEHFIIIESLRLGGYFQPEYRFSHIRTSSGVEVDLVIERPGKTTLFIEIKSSNQVTSDKRPFAIESRCRGL